MLGEISFIFWQNVLSIHQSAFLRNLSINNEVFLIVETDIENSRKSHGWIIPDFGGVKILTAPSNEKIIELLELRNCVHIFTGIDSFPLPAKVFKLAVQKKLKIGVMMEPFNWMGWKGKLRFLKYYVLQLKYDNKIDFILTTGNRGRWCYKKVGFSKNKIFDWGYFTESPGIDLKIENRNNIDKPSLLFVGSIDHRKNIISIVNICLKHQKTFQNFNIIGKGILENEIFESIKNSNIQYIGEVNNDKIVNYMSYADLLILPSLFDGWGAVVNEALMVGTPVLLSDECGASILINNSRGNIFSVTKNNFEEKFLEVVTHLKFGKFNRQEIKDWSAKNISGESAAVYFESIINSVYSNKMRPTAPWLKYLK